MADATIGALANLATATASDRGVVATLTQANAHLVKQLEDNSHALRELKALIKKERTEKCGWTHGYKFGNTHTSLTCKLPKTGQKKEAIRADNMSGSQVNKE
jgi:hypothetical protein